MRWGGFALVLLVTYLLQVAVLPVLGLRSIDAFLILAMLCGLLAPTHEGRIAAWTAGLVRDLGSGDTLGLNAFVLGLTGLFVTQARELLNTSVWWPRLVALFLGAWPGQILYRLHLYYWGGPAEYGLFRLLWDSGRVTLIAALIATLATTLAGLMTRSHRRFGMARRGR